MTAYRFPRPDTAFAVASPSMRKRPREKNDEHLKFIRRQECVICGTHKGVEAAHVRMASPIHGKRETGKGEKPSDKWCVPLCAEHHRLNNDSQHELGEAPFWSKYNINPCDLALALWAHTGDDDLAEVVIRAQRGIARRVNDE